MRVFQKLLGWALPAALLLFAAPALPQAVGPTIPAGTAPSAIAINPVTNKLYVANEGSNSVTVIDGHTHASSTVSVGIRPLWIAVNPETNKAYVSNFGTPNFQVIDGATNAVGPGQNMGDVGWMTINPVTNTVFNLRYGGGDEVNVIVNDVYQHTSATRSYQPVSIVVNPVTNVLYIAHQATGDVAAFDAGTLLPGGFPGGNPLYPKRLCPYKDGTPGYRPSPGQFDPDDGACIDIADPVVALAVNPVTNMVYAVSSSASNQITAIRGHGLTDPHTFTSFTPPGVSGAARAIAVNPVTNKVYAAFAGHVVVLDAATNAMTVIAAGAVAIGVNPSTNMIYAPNADGSLKVISGATNAVVATIAIPTGAKAIAVNPVTNKIFVITPAGVVPIQGSPSDVAQSIPLTTTITPLAGNASAPSGSITLTAAASSGMPAPRRVYFQIDGTTGAWSAASGSGPYTATFAGLSAGSHTLYAFATNALDAPSIMTDVQNNPLVGMIASYTFTVSASPPPRVDPSMSLATSQNPSTTGNAVTFTASLAGSAGTPTGTVAFRAGGLTITGCASVSLTGGSAACTTSALATGTHSITAEYSGDGAYNAANAGPVSQVVNAPKVNATIGLASSLNPSTAGQAVTFTASVSGSAGGATGTVDFRNGGTSISGCASVSLASGSATCSTSSLAAGTHSITVAYSGNASYNAGASSALMQTVNAVVTGTNVALASAGTVASASSSYNTGFGPGAVNNGERAGLNWSAGSGWNDATYGAFPDWVQLTFPGARRIDRVVVYSLQDNPTAPSEPTDAMTFTSYGLVDFDVQAWNGSTWQTIASVIGNNLVKRSVTFEPVTTTQVRLLVTHALGGYSHVTELEVFGEPAAGTPTLVNVALASAGANASASSTYSSAFPASAAIDGDRAGRNWGAGSGWNDATAGLYPDWLQVSFAGPRTLSRVVVYTLQDSPASPSEPTDTMTFSSYGIVDFTVEGWDGAAWVPLATVTGNNLVKRSVTFAEFTTTQVRVVVTNARGYSHIVEVEAWGYAPAGSGGGSNVALASAGAQASASSTYSSAFPASAAIDGDRAGNNWGAGSGWNDATAGVYPDWLQVDFSGTKTIDRVVVYTLQDSPASPSEPTDTMTFSSYGISDFDVEAWNGSAWSAVASVRDNNLVKRSVSFAPVATSRIRILVLNARGYSHITEVEAWGS